MKKSNNCAVLGRAFKFLLLLLLHSLRGESEAGGKEGYILKSVSGMQGKQGESRVAKK